MLKDSLNGNTKTTLLCTCSLRESNREETIRTLRFATNAKCVSSFVQRNLEVSNQQQIDLVNETANVGSNEIENPYEMQHTCTSVDNFANKKMSDYKETIQCLTSEKNDWEITKAELQSKIEHLMIGIGINDNFELDNNENENLFEMEEKHTSVSSPSLVIDHRSRKLFLFFHSSILSSIPLCMYHTNQ